MHTRHLHLTWRLSYKYSNPCGAQEVLYKQQCWFETAKKLWTDSVLKTILIHQCWFIKDAYIDVHGNSHTDTYMLEVLLKARYVEIVLD